LKFSGFMSEGQMHGEEQNLNCKSSAFWLS
jgi:hypothetical protein